MSENMDVSQSSSAVGEQNVADPGAPTTQGVQGAPMQGTPLQGAPMPQGYQAPPMQVPPMQGAPLQGAPMPQGYQAPPMQAPPVQAPPMQGAPLQGAPMPQGYQAPPMQVPPMQAPQMQGTQMQAPPMQGAPLQGAPMPQGYQAPPMQAPPMQAPLMQGAPMSQGYQAPPMQAGPQGYQMAPPMPVKKPENSFGTQLSLMFKNSWGFICDTFQAPLSAVHTSKIRWQEALLFSFVQMVFYMIFCGVYRSGASVKFMGFIILMLCAGMLSLITQALYALVLLAIKCILTKKPAKELWLSSYTESIQSGLFMTCAILLCTFITLFAPNQYTLLPIIFAIVTQVLILRGILVEKYAALESKAFYVLSGFYILQGFAIAIMYTILVQIWTALYTAFFTF